MIPPVSSSMMMNIGIVFTYHFPSLNPISSVFLQIPVCYTDRMLFLNPSSGQLQSVSVMMLLCPASIIMFLLDRMHPVMFPFTFAFMVMSFSPVLVSMMFAVLLFSPAGHQGLYILFVGEVICIVHCGLLMPPPPPPPVLACEIIVWRLLVLLLALLLFASRQ